jgi:putative DNA modification/repair radical SAM protein
VFSFVCGVAGVGGIIGGMTLEEKLAILTDAAKYDASCASSGSNRKGTKTGSTSTSGICHSWSSDGRCISLLKILLSNVCLYDCAYCINRRSNDRPRTTFSVSEVVSLTMEFYRRNYIEGLFLSSAVFGTPDRVMDRMVSIARRLRQEEGFGGYIHLKAIPGASLELMRQAGLFADRVSVNIELPSEASLKQLAPEKTKADIITPMAFLGNSIRESRAERRRDRRAPAFAPGGHSTQLIVGASPESDFQIVRLGESLYNHYDLSRVYYSAFIPVNRYDSRLQPVDMPPLLREHRLYQADWLLRNYGYRADELLSEKEPDLDAVLDPKAMWAVRNYHFFPIDVNRADYAQILRVPGIGVTSARRIVSARRFQALSLADLQKLGVVLKRAAYFIIAAGRRPGLPMQSVESVRRALTQEAQPVHAEQLTLAF